MIRSGEIRPILPYITNSEISDGRSHKQRSSGNKIHRPFLGSSQLAIGRCNCPPNLLIGQWCERPGGFVSPMMDVPLDTKRVSGSGNPLCESLHLTSHLVPIDNPDIYG